MNETELLRRLVSFDTTSALPNEPIVDFLAAFLDRRGVEIIRQESDSSGKLNLIAWIGPRESENGRGLVLSGHLDTVPAREPDWRSDPWQLVADDQNYYGRGTADMKGFLSLAAVAATRVNPSSLQHPLVLVFTCDEEIGTLGAASFSRTWPPGRPLPRAAIIGEPTSNRLVRMHKGHLKLRIDVRGVGAHSGYPHLGRNAIEDGARIVSALAALRDTLQNECPEHAEYFGAVPYASLNIATIRGGNAINVVPDFCTLEIGIRPMPGMDLDAIQDRVHSAIESAGADDWSLSLISSSPPMRARDDSPVHDALAAALNQKETIAVSFATDAGWFQTMGLDTVLFGPGAIEVAHKANEYIPKSELAAAMPIIESMIHRFCLA